MSSRSFLLSTANSLNQSTCAHLVACKQGWPESECLNTVCTHSIILLVYDCRIGEYSWFRFCTHSVHANICMVHHTSYTITLTVNTNIYMVHHISYTITPLHTVHTHICMVHHISYTMYGSGQSYTTMLYILFVCVSFACLGGGGTPARPYVWYRFPGHKDAHCTRAEHGANPTFRCVCVCVCMCVCM